MFNISYMILLIYYLIIKISIETIVSLIKLSHYHIKYT